MRHIISHIIAHKIEAEVDGFIATATVTICRLEENEIGDTIKVPALKFDVQHKVDDIQAAITGVLKDACAQAREVLVKLDAMQPDPVVVAIDTKRAELAQLKAQLDRQADRRPHLSVALTENAIERVEAEIKHLSTKLAA